ncbi:proline oxidase Put1 [Fonsecaea pedrosoi]|nr:proline oxidase Put1 [Fonsecaea pedrosoi]
MASSLANTLRTRVNVQQPLRVACSQRRSHSSAHTPTVINQGTTKEPLIPASTNAGDTTVTNPLARLSTSSLLRTLLLSTFFTSPWLFRPGFAVFEKIAHSQSAWLNPDRNPLVRAIVHPLVYKQFCAGRNQKEIGQTSAEIRRLGFSGVVLCYGREVQVEGDKFVGYDDSKAAVMDKEIEQWADGNLATLDMIGEGDWLGIKYSGAGTNITKALMKGDKAPAKFVEAMEKICQRAASKGCRIWIDAEQQTLQAAIDQWTFDLMRRYNQPGRRALIYNTIQAYLKSSRDKVQHQLQLSRQEGWRLGIKLVRGAYINNDIREAIHDTKADTDASYNGIVEDLLCGKFPAMADQESVDLDLLLAGHNASTIRGAARLASTLAAESKLKVVPEFGQLQGMADDIGCELLQMADNTKRDSTLPLTNTYIPRVYKCLTWGSIQECMQYLTRRLVENRGAADRMKVGAAEFRKELLRRIGIRT